MGVSVNPSKKTLLIVFAAIVGLAVFGMFLPDERKVAFVNSSDAERTVRVGDEEVLVAPRSVEVKSVRVGSREVKVTGAGGFTRSATLVLAKDSASDAPTTWLDVDGTSRFALVNADALYERTVLGVKVGAKGRGNLIRKVYAGAEPFVPEIPATNSQLVGPFEPLPKEVSKDTTVFKLVVVPGGAQSAEEIVEAVLNEP